MKRVLEIEVREQGRQTSPLWRKIIVDDEMQDYSDVAGAIVELTEKLLEKTKPKF